MPELPEVENVRRQLSCLEGMTIVHAQLSPFALRYRLAPQDIAQLRGRRVEPPGPTRAGRYILLPLGDSKTLMLHLGMTGSLRIEARRAPQTHDHLWLDFVDDGGRHATLVYNDPRRFGGASLLGCASTEQARALLGLGLEPTAPIEPSVVHALYRGSRPIKPLLMDNALITGIGNIYANEICYAAQISPFRPGSSLSFSDAEILASEITRIIAQAIDHGGSTFRNYVHVDGTKGGAQQFHLAYGRAGSPCPRCGAKIEAATQAGRATFHCPACQV
jgi:formamidopyrimidine-DNA glycosylase